MGSSNFVNFQGEYNIIAVSDWACNILYLCSNS